MTNEEYLNQRLGSPRNAFKVPDGYFDNFTQDLMAKLPEQNTAIRLQRKPVVRMWMYAAASAVIAVFTVSAYFLFQEQEAPQPQQFSEATPAAVYSDSYIDEAMNYAMMDNHDIYAALYSE
jgi:hypothetical protein